MLNMDAAAVKAATPWPALIDALEAMFAAEGTENGCVFPLRAHHQVPRIDQPEATLLLMPAWSAPAAAAGVIGVKLVTVFPGNAAKGMAAIDGAYVVFDGEDGRLRAVLDGGELTARRTAAASGLAARHLSREDSKVLVIVGTGRLAANLAAAHCAVRPIERILVCGRSAEKAARAAAAIVAETGRAAEPAEISAAAAQADIISAATLSETPLIRGADLKPGAHVDLVGAFKPTMRESDDEVMRRAATVVVDTYGGGFSEAGDVVLALESGALTKEKVVAELAELARGDKRIARGAEDITVFKSVGAALEDLAAAMLCLKQAG
ncbi:MAG: ornithine cyclodeaminase family protein [Rhodobacteraceae bacterium]|nr:ornithine cyclodeaminase family protein [Paracoccaceae bacterium]